MWKVKVEITLTVTDDEYTQEGRQMQVQIEESIPDGFQNLDQWESNVHNLGFRAMRELFKRGIELYEEKILSEYTHKDGDCQTQRRGFREFTLRTVFGKVTFPRQRIYCKTCGQWVIPINEALGLHDDEQERATIGFKELSCLYAIHHPYRSAAEKVEQSTRDPQIVSHEQIRQIVQAEGKGVRQHEEEERKDAVFCMVKSIQEHPNRKPSYNGRLYVNMDGILVHSSSGKGLYHEGKIGFICTDDREPAGRRVRITRKRYVSSFENSYVLGGRVRGEALKLGIRAYKEAFILGDGARWIRKVREQCFPGTVYILDWYHLHENLYEALRIALPYEAPDRRAVHRKVSKYFWRGLKRKALAELELLRDQLLSEGKQKRLEQRKGLNEFIEYVQNNWEGIINYREMYKAGYLVASSLAEKAADLVVAKRQKKHQGMHWTRMGADNLSALRTLWLNGDWKEYWRERREKAA
jgi:hypothetical protein